MYPIPWCIWCYLPPPPCEQRDACENITTPQLRLRAGMIKLCYQHECSADGLIMKFTRTTNWPTKCCLMILLFHWPQTIRSVQIKCPAIAIYKYISIYLFTMSWSYEPFLIITSSNATLVGPWTSKLDLNILSPLMAIIKKKLYHEHCDLLH